MSEDAPASGPVNRRRPLLPGMSTRLRILLWCTFLVAIALAASVVATRVVLFQNLASETDADLAHEFVELGLGSPLAAAPAAMHGMPENEAQLLAAFGRANPSHMQELVAISDGKVLATSPSPPRHKVASDPALLHTWAAVRAPTYGTVQTLSGTVRYLAAPFGPAPGGTRAGGRDVVVAISFVDRERGDVTATVRTASIVGLLALAAAIAIAWLIAGRILAPVRQLERAARTVTESDLSHRLEVNGDDELARLAGDFNAMLDRVESAFRTQRQFIDDAGHELRTPLTVIRGHLELLGDDPEERREVQAIITDELDRMSRMVNDLLVLAGAERPDFLQTAPVDVGQLTGEVQEKARFLADRQWLDGGHADKVTLVDRQRLTQAWMQLAQNATQHTSEGDQIAIGSWCSDDYLDLWVGDSGPGIPADERDGLFEGFSRGAHARRSGEHFGLGLPIVRAIAVAHGGMVTVGGNVLGGALFTIRIPVTPVAPPSAP
jgi:two-component system OmpR family sensor kinase